MSEKKLRILLVTVFFAAAIASTGCRGRGVGLNTTVPSDGVTPPQAVALPFFGQSPTASTTIAEPNGFTEYGNETGPSGGSAIPIDIAPPATQITPGPTLPANVLDTSPGAFTGERLSVREDTLLAGGTTPSGTRPGGQRLGILPRNNPEATDLLDHWGHRRSQAIKKGLSLTPQLSGSDTFDLQAIRAAAERRSRTTIASNLQDGDEVQILGTRRGVSFGRWSGGPGDTLSIDFDLSAASSLITDDPAFRTMLERAGKAWSHRIVDTWTRWERSPGELKGWLNTSSGTRAQVRVGPEGEISTGVEIVVKDVDLPESRVGRANQGVQPRGDSWEPHFGSISLKREFLEETSGQEPSGALLLGQIHHKIGHVLGAWKGNPSPNIWRGDSSLILERIDSYVDKTTGAWSGPNVVALHGGPAPFQDASDPYAWVNGQRDSHVTDFEFNHSGICASVMAYCRHQNALQVILPDAIDFAFLKDLGMTITEETERPETYGLAGWTDYAAFTVSVSRDLQIALADPQPHYGNGGSRWSTLDVIDLLQAEVDAFGYLSTGSFRQSHAAKGLDGTVRYLGGLLGAALDHAGLPPVTGDATLSVDLATLDGRASFISLKVYPDGTPEPFAGGSLHYPIELSVNTIVGTAPGATFQADFYGPMHEDVAGVLHDPRAGLLASFGATLDERPSKEDVIASADYMVGLSIRWGSINPVDDGWNQYRCGTDGVCEARDDDLNRWNPWVTTTRENVLTSSAGWTWRNAAKPEADYDILRLERFTSASTDGGRGRYVVDGLNGTLEHMAFGAGFERYNNWETNTRSNDFLDHWTGLQGTLSDSLPGGNTQWSGRMLGYHSGYYWGENPLVEGRVTVDFSLSTNLVDVKFSDVASRDGKRKLSDFGFEDLQASADGTFSGGTEGLIHGAFFGPAQEEAGGIFQHNAAQVTGSFGALSEEALNPITQADAAVPEQLALHENSLLVGGITSSGTKPGGQRLDIQPRNNPEAADLLDHWGHRRTEGIKEGLSLTSPLSGSDTFDLQTPRAAAERHTNTTIAPNLYERDEVRSLGTRRGVAYGRWAGGAADTLSIDFDLSGAGPLMSEDPAFRAMLERAGKAWSHRIADTWTPWERSPGELKGTLARGNPYATQTEVRVGSDGEISTGLDIDVRYENFTDGAAGRGGGGFLLSGDFWEPRFGTIVIDTEHLQENHGTSRLFHTLTHEMGHVLGAWTTDSYPEHLLSYVDRTTGVWSGPNVVALHGGPAPFQDASDTHAWVNGERDPNATNFDFAHSGVCASLMAYCSDESALPTFLPHAIDFAFLKDIGLTITEETERAETYGLAGWTDYAAFMVSVSRDLQIALADPQPHYGYHGGPWYTLDVVDLLQAEVDAFGYLSTGIFRSSYAVKGPGGTVRYTGGLLGAALDHSGLPPVTGDASLSVEIASLDGTASFTSLKVYPDGTPEVFAEGSLHYPIKLSANTIVGTAPGATFQADFYGPKHEEVAGVLHDPRAGLLASFGATHDERPTREDVIASADYLVGLSRLINTPDPLDDRWYHLRCGTDASCEMRNKPTGPVGWSDWMTSTRENALASTAGWVWRNTARPEAERDFVRIERLTSASTDEARGRHVVDGYTGTMEHVAFGTGFEHYTNWTTEPEAISPDFEHRWTGVQGTMSGYLPGGHARWSGLMLGYQYNLPSSENRLVEGRATVDFWLSTHLIDVMFSEVASRDGQRDLPDFGFGDLQAAADGTFSGSAEGIIHGAFFGPDHDEAGGTFHHYEMDVFGSFGARRDALIVAPENSGPLAIQAPIVDLRDTLHIGANVAPPAEQLTTAADYNGVAVSSGHVEDGVGADRVLEFLEPHVSGGLSRASEGFTYGSNTVGLPTFPGRPTIRLAEGTREEFTEHVVRAIQLINAALPYEKRILFSQEPAPPLAAIENVPDGQIFVDFAPSAEDWNLANSNYRPGAAGISEPDPIQEFNYTTERWEYKNMRAGHVWMDVKRIMNTAWVRNPATGNLEEKVLENPVVESDTVLKVYPAEDVFSIVLHELIHALGFLAHNDSTRFPESVMRDNYLLVTKQLPRIDREALLAAYTRFEPSIQPEELSAENLGSWDDTSFHLHGNLDFEGGEVSFGVAAKNGLAQPWASGPKPWAKLADNSALFGTVTWNGALLGVTPSVETVAGGARLSVELATLTGQLDFTNMEKWGVKEAPGAVGSGTMWGDGDLGYTIKVSENTFVQTGGDDGQVTGAFFGPAHEAMGGVLERTDLAAAFGGKR